MNDKSWQKLTKNFFCEFCHHNCCKQIDLDNLKNKKKNKKEKLGKGLQNTSEKEKDFELHLKCQCVKENKYIRGIWDP